MRLLRLFLLGLASIYPLYWTAQFALFFLPASLRALILQVPLTVVDISYLQATAVLGRQDSLPVGFESLVAALLLSLVIWCLRGDSFLAGGIAIVVMGQSAMLPFLNDLIWQRGLSFETVFGIFATLGIICFGLQRILRRTGGANFLDRLALLSLLAVLPQSLLWLAFRLNYPYFGTKFLLMLLIPLYFGAMLVSGVPLRSSRESSKRVRTPVPLSEIFASALVAGLLFAAIGLTTHFNAHRGTVATQEIPQVSAH